ncbi:MAG: NAD/NADP octopine/nopaline dehydrogenase family protein, partial [Thaumarchaeota archaeon]|nr:NAD/NADP octopine/nopaline dehydrogenase family protein [Nitrososphaerota archaeon]
IEAVDKERIAVGKVFGLRPRTFVEYFSMAGYTARGDVSVREAIVSSVPDRHIRSPSSLNHRYLIEDVAYGLVPMAYLARVAGIETPIIDSLIHVSGRLNGVDHWREGLTLQKMGVDGMDVKGINKFVKEGFARSSMFGRAR